MTMQMQAADDIHDEPQTGTGMTEADGKTE